MFRCGARPVNTGNVTAQDDTVSLSLVGTENLPSSSPSVEDDDDPTAFDDIRQVVIHDHNDLPTSFGYLTDNALVYISGFVVKKV